VVVASRTSEHLNDFKALADEEFTGMVLVEKPLFHEDGETPRHAFKDVFVAYNLRFHPVVQAVANILARETVVAVHAYVGQHLADWRHQRDYRGGYSASKDQGGGVLRDLSHELDYLNWMLGGWHRLTASGGHFSDLEIDSDDVFSLLVETQRCAVASVHMNYLDRPARREIVALTAAGTVRADLVAGRVSFRGRTDRFTVANDDTYRAQHHAILSGDATPTCRLEEGKDVVRMIAAAERAATDRVWVSR
jgi:predicted dehydrogenase